MQILPNRKTGEIMQIMGIHRHNDATKTFNRIKSRLKYSPSNLRIGDWKIRMCNIKPKRKMIYQRHCGDV